MTDYLYAGPIDTEFSARVIPSNRIAYHCETCGCVTDAGVCDQCAGEAA